MEIPENSILLNSLPLAYALHKILLNEENDPIDYVFLDVNTSFEMMMGATKESILGKKVTEVIPQIREDDFDWIQYYGTIALQGLSESTVTYSSALKKWFRIHTYSPEKYYFVTYFSDISEEMSIIDEHSVIEQKMIREMISKNLINDILLYMVKSNVNHADDTLQVILKDVTRTFKVDRCYIFSEIFGQSNHLLACSSEWHVKDIPSQSEHFDTMDLNHFSEFRSELLDRPYFLINDIDAIQGEYRAKKYPFFRNSLKSILCLKLMDHSGTFLGFLGLDSVNAKKAWTEEEIETLQVISSLIVEYLTRIRTETQLINARIETENANIVKSQFLANMTHELRTPINSITGFAQLLSMTTLDQEQEEYLGFIKNSASGLLDLINDVLDVSHSNTHSHQRIDVTFNLYKITMAVIEAYKAISHEKNLELSILFRNKIPRYVKGDPYIVKRILSQILSNAIKFSNKGTILVEITHEMITPSKMDLKYKVIDHGIGIPKEKLNTLFDAFTQLDGSFTRDHSGSGLGLYTAKNLLNQVNGNIEIESALNIGTTVHFNMPFALVIDPDVEMSMDHAALQGKKFGLISGSEANRLIIQDYLEEKGGILFTGESFESFKSTCEDRGSPSLDLIIIDTKLNTNDHLATCSRLSTDPLYNHIPLVLLKGDQEATDTSIFKSFQIIEWIKKPFHKDTLIDVLVKIIQTIDENKKSIHTPSDHPKNVLIVEDNDVNSLFLEKLLTMKGFRCECAKNGLDAVKTCQTHHFDLIFMDCQMPIMDGFDATKNIRLLNNTNAHTPIIAITAFTMENDKRKCLESGMDKYVTKPIDIEELFQVIAECDTQNKVLN